MAQEAVQYASKAACAKEYAVAGYRVFPLQPNGKAPLVSAWKADASREPEQVRAWWTTHPEANIGVVAEGFLAVDVDCKNGKRGDLALQDYLLAHGHELPEGWKAGQVRTPSGGWHLYLRDPSPTWTSQADALGMVGVDLKGSGKGYVVGIGSTVDGKAYTGSIVPVETLPLVPAWLQKHPTLPKPALRVVHGGPVLSKVQRLLGRIDPSTLNYEQWIKVGMACKAASVDALSLWDEWSAKDARYKPGECAYKWSTFPDDGSVSMGTLYFMAGERREDEESLVERLAASGLDTSMQLLIEQTDVAVGQEFLNIHGELVAPESERTWRVWDGAQWITGGDARQYVGDLLDQFLEGKIAEASKLPRSENSRASQLFKFYRQCLNQKKRAGILSYIATQGYVNPERFDSDEHLVGLQGGQVLDMRSCTARPVTPDDRVTKKLGTAYNPDAACPRWLEFLHTAMKGDASMVEFLQVITGYFLTADVTEQKFFFFYGAAGAGKSTFLDTIKSLMGDYGRKVSTDMVLLNKWGTRSNHSHSNVADMRGARFTYTDEINDADTRLDTGQVKSLTGDAFIHGKRLYQDGMTFKATSKLVMYGNHKPAADFTDEGLWRRMCVVPFNNPVPASSRDTRLGDTIRQTELPGVLLWALEGYRKWAAKGLSPYIPATVIADSEEYQREQDNVSTFLEHCIELDPFAEGLASSELYAAYTEWCRGEHESPVPKRSAMLGFAGFFKRKRIESEPLSRTKRGYRGIKFRLSDTETQPLF